MSRSARIVVAALALLVATAVVRFGVQDSPAQSLGRLSASIGPGFQIQLALPDGTPVSSIAAGTYEVHVDDRAANHNFHLEGPGVNLATGIGDIGEADWVVAFGNASYTFRCDAHASLSGTFAAGTASASAPASAAPAAPPTLVVDAPPVLAKGAAAQSDLPRAVAANARVRGTLLVVLGPGQAVRLTRGHAAVRTIPSGVYAVRIVDRSVRHGISIRRIGGSVSGLTARGFTGTTTVKLRLSRGQWKLYSPAAEQAFFAFFRVTR